MVTGTWWLLREVELSTLRACLVETSTTPEGLPVVALTLPASKTDQRACGVARGHRCRCSEVASPVACPAHAVMDQLLFLRRQFPSQWHGQRAADDLPLFPQRSGRACSKPAMVGTIASAAGRLQVPLANPDGTTRVSGHSLRVGGAQGLARRGFPTWSIQLMGRWGTETVKQYIGDAALDVFTGPAAATGQTPDATDLTDFIAAAARLSETSAEARGGQRRRLPRTPQDSVEEQFGQLAGALRVELAGAVAQEVRLELAARARAVPPPPNTMDQGTATETPDPTVWAQNVRTEVWHIVSLGPGSGHPSPQWASHCGWSFGVSGGFALEQPAPGDELCKRCRRLVFQRTGREVVVA